MLEKTEAWERILGAVQDRPLADVARKFGVTPGAITSALIRTRTRRKPVPVAGSEPAPPPKQAGGQRRQAPKAEMVNGLKVRSGTRDRAIAELADLLGVEPDSVIAERAGVSTRTVATFRRANNIAGKRGRGASKARTTATPISLPPEKGNSKQFRQRGKASKLDPYFDELGRVPDREIAAKAGVTSNAVAAYRRRRGIASVRDNQAAGLVSAPVKSVPAAAPAPAPVTPARAVAPAPTPPVTRTAAPAQPRAQVTASVPRSAAKSPSAAAPALPSGRIVFKVERSDGTFSFVVADGFVNAAKQTEGHLNIVAIHLAGEML